MNRDRVYEAGICAKCHSDKILYSDPIIDEQLIYPYECEECHAKGKEYYDLDFNCNETEA